jgi:hypothetical protein
MRQTCVSCSWSFRSIEYLNDIAAELRRLARGGALPPEERLRVLLTAAELAHGQAGVRVD